MVIRSLAMLTVLAALLMMPVGNAAAEDQPQIPRQTPDRHNSAPRSILIQPQGQPAPPVPSVGEGDPGSATPLRPLRPSEQISLDTPVDFPSDI